MISLTTIAVLSTALVGASEVALPVVEKPMCVVVYPNDMPLIRLRCGKSADDVEWVDACEEYAAGFRAGWDECWSEFDDSQARQRPPIYVFPGQGYFSSDLDIPFAQSDGFQQRARDEGYSRCADRISLALTRPGIRSRPPKTRAH